MTSPTSQFPTFPKRNTRGRNALIRRRLAIMGSGDIPLALKTVGAGSGNSGRGTQSPRRAHQPPPE
eukprot:11176304-Lingulodinium_polyedra.AAC.1